MENIFKIAINYKPTGSRISTNSKKKYMKKKHIMIYYDQIAAINNKEKILKELRRQFSKVDHKLHGKLLTECVATHPTPEHLRQHLEL
jgi:hypothetical protein